MSRGLAGALRFGEDGGVFVATKKGFRCARSGVSCEVLTSSCRSLEVEAGVSLKPRDSLLVLRFSLLAARRLGVRGIVCIRSSIGDSKSQDQSCFKSELEVSGSRVSQSADDGEKERQCRQLLIVRSN